jgi:hypothetical protein
MVRAPDATIQPAPQDNQLMSRSQLRAALRLERRGQDGQSETEQPDHSASLSDSITSSTRMVFDIHAGEGHLRRNLISYAAYKTPSERIGRSTRMRRFFVRFSRSESFVHTRSSVGFTIITSGFEFSVHTGPKEPSFTSAVAMTRSHAAQDAQ